MFPPSLYMHFRSVQIMIGCLLGLLSVPMQGGDREVIQFNDFLARQLQEARKPFEPFWETIAPWYAGNRIERKAVKEAFHQLDKEHLKVLNAVLECPVPAETLCQEFHQAVIDYLSVDREIIAAYHGALRFMLDHNPASRRKDVDHVVTLVNPIIARQEPYLRRISVLQVRLAQAHGFNLRRPEGSSLLVVEKTE